MVAMETFTEERSEAPKDKFLMANNIIVIQNGSIVNNPFSHRLELSHTSQWMVANKKAVTSRIGYWFREMYVASYGGNVDDCFGYAIDYFTESKRRAFRKSYFGKESTYDVRSYCFSQLKYIVQNYLKELRGGVDIQSFVTSDEMEAVGKRYGVVEETIARTLQVSVEDQAINQDYLAWDAEYDWLEDYEDYFTDKNYKKFDIVGYLTYMYLDVQEENIEDHVKYVAQKIGESVEMIALVTDDFRRDVIKKEDRAIDLLKEISGLVGAVKTGWKPKRIREENR